MDDDDVVSKVLHLGQQVAGYEHGASVGCPGTEQVPQLANALRIEAVSAKTLEGDLEDLATAAETTS